MFHFVLCLFVSVCVYVCMYGDLFVCVMFEMCIYVCGCVVFVCVFVRVCVCMYV